MEGETQQADSRTGGRKWCGSCCIQRRLSHLLEVERGNRNCKQFQRLHDAEQVGGA